MLAVFVVVVDTCGFICVWDMLQMFGPYEM
jgi:hypothetical protein